MCVGPNEAANVFIVIIRDVNSWEIAFPGWETQFPDLDRDSWFRPSMYLLPAWSELDRRRAREGGGAIGGAGRQSSLSLHAPASDPIIQLRSLGPYRRMRTIDQQQAVARQKCHKKDSRVLLTSLVIVYNKWLTCSFIWYQLSDTLHTSENYCLYINNNILRQIIKFEFVGQQFD